MNIAITVTSKVATLTSPTYAVNDNTDYTVVFTFDSEWDDLSSKTARFAYLGGYTDVVFSGTSCTMPKLSNCDLCLIGVYAGDLHTTTPAKLPMVRSILKSGGSPIAPSSSVYDQIMTLLNSKITEPDEEGDYGQVLMTDGDGGRLWVTAGGSGTGDYTELTNKPKINGTELVGNTVLQVLPEPSATDNGKIAKIVNGQWAIAEDLKLSITETANPEGGNTLTIGG